MPDICIWSGCDQKCVMCSNPVWWRWDNKLYSLKEIKKSIDKYTWWFQAQFERFGEYSDTWVITGGEPTMNPEYFEILSYIRKNFPKSQLVQLTHGKRFADEEFAKRISSIDNYQIVLPLHGYNSATHDKVVWIDGSFKQVIKALFNIIKYKNNGQIIEVRTVITKYSYKYLEKIYKLILKLFPEVDNVVTIFMEFEWHAIHNIKEVGVTYTEVMDQNKEIFQKYSSIMKDFKLYHFPLCTVDKSLWPYLWRTLPDVEIEFLDQCKGCALKKYCMWVHEWYIPHNGSSEIKAFSQEDIKSINIEENLSNFEFNPIISVR